MYWQGQGGAQAMPLWQERGLLPAAVLGAKPTASLHAALGGSFVSRGAGGLLRLPPFLPVGRSEPADSPDTALPPSRTPQVPDALARHPGQPEPLVALPDIFLGDTCLPCPMVQAHKCSVTEAGSRVDR